ncbi:hypothetical protein [Pseudolactococcus laudensis]|uniref:hypothetical protein n=1 Tax=Pseudolactococcus laudensis TaxID=1494461 RepID=UPI0002775391|nr:hypothetical protein BN193_02060 [Lactococcus raffinolactis 4877]
MSEFDPLTTLASRLIAEDVIRRVNEFDKLQAKLRATERVLPYISKQETMRDLDISDNTMSKFESNGLQRYKPDYNSSLIYYLIDDICKFIVLAD